MSKVMRSSNAVVRAVLGLLAGAVLGVCIISALHEAISYDPWRYGPVLLFIGAAVGAVVGVIIGVWVGAVAGILLGVLAGVAYGAWVAAALPEDQMTRGAAEVYHRSVGIGIGVPAGCILGGLSGWVVGRRGPDDLANKPGGAVTRHLARRVAGAIRIEEIRDCGSAAGEDEEDGRWK
jgi:hypothetical protein